MPAYYKSRVVYPNRKQERRKRTIGFAFFAFSIFVFVGLLGFGLYSFAQLEKFRIKNIAVEGTRVLSHDEIRGVATYALDGSLFFFIPKNHYAFMSSRNLAETLQKEFPRIRTVSVKKSFPDGIKIFLEERMEWGIWCSELRNKKQELTAIANSALTANGGGQNHCGYIDREGVLFEYPLKISGAFLPVIFDDSRSEIRGGERVVAADVISFFETARNRAKPELGIVFTELEISQELLDDYYLYTNEGWYALVPRLGDQALWFNPLKALLHHELQNRAELEYIDARFGNKLFYKRKER